MPSGPTPGSPAGAFRSMLIETVKQGASINSINTWLAGTSRKGLRAASFSRKEAGEFFSHALHAMRQAVLLRSEPPNTVRPPQQPIFNPFLNLEGHERYEYMVRIRSTDSSGTVSDAYTFLPSDVALTREDAIDMVRGRESMRVVPAFGLGWITMSMTIKKDYEIVAIQKAY